MPIAGRVAPLAPKDLYSSMSKYGTYLLSAKTIGSHTRHTEFLHGLNAKIINLKTRPSSRLWSVIGFISPSKATLLHGLMEFCV